MHVKHCAALFGLIFKRSSYLALLNFVKRQAGEPEED